MPDFTYTARSSVGAAVQGTLTAASRQEALRWLAGQALMPVRIEASESSAVAPSRKVSRKHLAASFSQLADLMESGVSLLRSIEIVAKGTSHAGLAQVLKEVRDRVADGLSFADALGAHRDIVPEVAISIVHAGEEGGFLDESLRQIAGFFDRQDELESRVRGALAYPAFLMGTGALVGLGMLIFFVPKFAPLFQRLARRGELPALTQLTLGVSEGLREHWGLAGGNVAVLVIMLWRWLQQPAARESLDKWRLRIPVVGPILREFAVARFCRILGTLLKNGVPILRALRIARDAPGNREMSRAIDTAADQLSSGRSLAQPLSKAGVFPSEVLEMIAVSEHANRLDHVLVDVSGKLEQRAQRRLDLCVRMLEPILLVVLAGLILILVIALLLPVLRTAGHLS